MGAVYNAGDIVREGAVPAVSTVPLWLLSHSVGVRRTLFSRRCYSIIRLKMGSPGPIKWELSVETSDRAYFRSGSSRAVLSRLAAWGCLVLSQWFGVGLAVAAVQRRRDIIRDRLFPTHLHTMPRGALVSCVSLETMRAPCITIPPSTTSNLSHHASKRSTKMKTRQFPTKQRNGCIPDRRTRDEPPPDG